MAVNNPTSGSLKISRINTNPTSVSGGGGKSNLSISRGNLSSANTISSNVPSFTEYKAAQIPLDARQLTYKASYNDVFEYIGPNEGYVKKFDSYVPGRDNYSVAASRQTNSERFFNGIKQFGALSSNAFLNQANSTFLNLSKIATGDFTNFFDSAASDKYAERAMAVQYKYPIYNTDAMRQYQEGIKTGDNKLLKTIGKYVPYVSPNAGAYWSQFLGQMGFTAGTLGYFAVEQLALSGLGGGAGLVALPRKLYKVSNSFFDSAKILDKIYDSKKLASFGDKAVKSSASLLRAVNVASGEARLEANIAQREFINEEIKLFEEREGRKPEGADLEEINRNSLRVGNFTFNWQIPVLSFSNIVALQTIIKPATRFKAVPSRIGKRIVAENGKFQTQKQLIQGALPKMGYGARKFLTSGVVGLNLATEGFEELGQGLAARTAKRLFGTEYGDYADSVRGRVKAFGDEFANTFDTGVGWDEVVSGALMGLVSGAGGYTVRRQGFSEENAARQLASALNTTIDMNASMAKSVYGQMMGINSQNAYAQTEIANEQSIAAEEGDMHRLKNLVVEAQGELFRQMYRTGKSDEAIDVLFEQYQDLETDNPGLLKSILGGKSVESAKASLKEKYKSYEKITEDSQFFFSKRVQDEQKPAFDFVVHQLALAKLGSQDSFARMQNIIQTLQENIASQTDANSSSKIFEALDSLLKPDALSDRINEVQSLIESTKQVLEDTTNLSESNVKSTQAQLAKDEQYLKLLQSMKNELMDEKGNVRPDANPEVVATNLANFIREFDSKVDTQDIELNLRDFVKLEAENADLTFFSNAMRNEAFFDKYIDTITRLEAQQQAEFLLNLNIQPTIQKEEKKEDTAKTEELNKEQEKAREQETKAVEEAKSKDESLTDEIIESLKSRLRAVIQLADGTFRYGGENFQTREQVDQAVLDSMGENRDAVAPVFDAIKANIPVKQERVSESGPTKTTPAKSQKAKEEVKKKNEESRKSNYKPRTIEQIINAANSFTVNLANGILTLFTNKAFIKHHSSTTSLTKFIKEAPVTRLVKAAKKGGNLQMVTLHLNDTALDRGPQGFAPINSSDITGNQPALINALNTNGILAIRDLRGRLIILTRARTAKEAAGTISKYYNLYYDEVQTRNNFGVVRQGSPSGAIVGSTFNQEYFTEESERKLNSLNLQDEVTVVIPNNEANRKIIQDYVNTNTNSKRQAKKAFQTLADNLVILFQKDGVTVGMLNATGFYEGHDQGTTKAIRDIRNSIINSSTSEAIMNGETTLGVMKIDTISSIRNRNLNSVGEAQTSTVSEYEKSLKVNPDLDVSFNYYLAESSEKLVDIDNGSVKGRRDFKRKSDLRAGAVYMAVTDNKTGRIELIEVANEDGSSFTREQLAEGTYKDELLTVLQKGQLPYVAVRMAVEKGSFQAGKTSTTNHLQSVKSKINALKGATEMNVVAKGIEKPLREVEIDYDSQTITGSNPNGEQETISFDDISDINAYDDLGIPTVNVKAVQEQQEVEETTEEAETTEKVKGPLESKFNFPEGVEVTEKETENGSEISITYDHPAGKGKFTKRTINATIDKDGNISYSNTVNGRVIKGKKAINSREELENYIVSRLNTSKIKIQEPTQEVAQEAETVEETSTEDFTIEQTLSKTEDNAELFDSFFGIKDGATVSDLIDATQKLLQTTSDVVEIASILDNFKTLLGQTNATQSQVNTIIQNMTVESSEVSEAAQSSRQEQDTASEESLSHQDAYDRASAAGFDMEMWLYENGIEGYIYNLGGGNTIRIIKRNEDGTMEMSKNETFNITVDENFQLVSSDLQKISDELDSNPPSDVELASIIDKNEADYTLRDKLILEKFKNRIKELKKKLKVISLFNQNYDTYVTDSLKKLLSAYGYNVEDLLLSLTIQYHKGGRQASNLRELMKTVKISNKKASEILQVIGYANYTYIWALVTQSEVVSNGFEMENLRDVLASRSVKTLADVQAERDRMMAEMTATEEESSSESPLSQADSRGMFTGENPIDTAQDLVDIQYEEKAFEILKGFFAEGSVYIDKLQLKDNIGEEEYRTILDAVEEFITSRQGPRSSSRDAEVQTLVSAIVSFNDKVSDIGLHIDISNLFRVVKRQVDESRDNIDLASEDVLNIFGVDYVSPNLLFDTDVIAINFYVNNVDRNMKTAPIPLKEGGFEMQDIANKAQNAPQWAKDLSSAYFNNFGVRIDEDLLGALDYSNSAVLSSFANMRDALAEFEVDIVTPANVSAIESNFNEKKGQDEVDDKMC